MEKKTWVFLISVFLGGMIISYFLFGNKKTSDIEQNTKIEILERKINNLELRDSINLLDIKKRAEIIENKERTIDSLYSLLETKKEDYEKLNKKYEEISKDIDTWNDADRVEFFERYFGGN